MAKFIDKSGALAEVALTPDIYKAAQDANLTVKAYLNRTYEADTRVGTAYEQFKASLGLITPKDGNYGLRAPTVAQILDGVTTGAVVQGQSTPFGSESRVLFPTVVVDMVENVLQKDRETEASLLDKSVAVTYNTDGDHFLQPVINYSKVEGNPRAQRVAQLAEPANLVTFTTTDTFKKIPTYALGAEFSQQALRNTTLDMVGLTLARYLAVERDASAYEGINNMVSGDGDINSGAVTAVTTTSLDAAATGGVITHKAWVRFLAQARKTRRIDTIICDINAYLAIEGRTGRPGTVAYDPRLASIDPQAAIINNTFGGDVKIILVDTAAEGGPLAANTVVGMDSRYAIAKAINLQAEYAATQEFVMRRSEALRIDYGSVYFRYFNDAWTVLTIA